jgi:hypothetical protein
VKGAFRVSVGELLGGGGGWGNISKTAELEVQFLMRQKCICCHDV